jgi:disulfide bond formation protein DsbB
MLKFSSFRSLYICGFIIVAILLSFAYYLQEYGGVDPCPLCILQRIDLSFMGILFLIGASLSAQQNMRRRDPQLFVRTSSTFTAKVQGLLTGLNTFFAGIGIGLASRQVWLQHQPSSAHIDCSASLHYLLKVLPLTEVLKKVLTGTAECSKTGWQWLHLSMAQWALAWFAILLVLIVAAARAR